MASGESRAVYVPARLSALAVMGTDSGRLSWKRHQLLGSVFPNFRGLNESRSNKKIFINQ